MVSYTVVKASNAKISTTLPAGLVAVFVGGTNGIGEYTLKQFAQHTVEPRVYFVGRSVEAGDRIAKECQELNPKGTFTFIKRDTSLVRNVDELCQELKSKEKAINLLFLSTGTLDFTTDTSEGLKLAAALVHYTRARSIQNLLPELQAAKSLRRVVSVFAATKEGQFFLEHIGNPEKVSLIKGRGHAASLVTMGMESLARQAPSVSFVHTFPGPVKSGIGRDLQGIMGMSIRFVFGLIGPFIYIPNDESGAYHLYFSTSAQYQSRDGKDVSQGVLMDETLSVARGNDGQIGSGMYCIEDKGESAGSTVEALLAGFRQEGLVEKVWVHTEEEWKRILETAKL